MDRTHEDVVPLLVDDASLLAYLLSAGLWVGLSVSLYYWLKPPFNGLFQRVGYMGYVANVQGLMIFSGIFCLFVAVGFYLVLERSLK